MQHMGLRIQGSSLATAVAWVTAVPQVQSQARELPHAAGRNQREKGKKKEKEEEEGGDKGRGEEGGE